MSPLADDEEPGSSIRGGSSMRLAWMRLNDHPLTTCSPGATPPMNLPPTYCSNVTPQTFKDSVPACWNHRSILFGILENLRISIDEGNLLLRPLVRRTLVSARYSLEIVMLR